MEHVRDKLKVSERRVCRVIGQPRSTQRYVKQIPEDEEPLTRSILWLAGQFGRYGYHTHFLVRTCHRVPVGFVGQLFLSYILSEFCLHYSNAIARDLASALTIEPVMWMCIYLLPN